jgi:hypothetical protein
MKSSLLIGLLSFGLGLNTALLVVTVVKTERIEKRLVTRELDRVPEKPMLFGLPEVDPERLGLSEAQQQEVEALREQWKQEEHERRQASLDRRESIPDFFENDDVTMAQLLPFLDQAHEESKARLEALLRFYRAYQEILTPEQRESFRQMIREQKERHHVARREARMRMEKFMNSRGGPDGADSENRSRGERVRRMFRRDAPEGETTFGPGRLPRRPGGARMDDLPPEGPMPGEPPLNGPFPGDPAQAQP